MSRTYRAPEPLADHHDLSRFRCRSSEQTDWLHRYARQSASSGTTRVFGVTEHGRDRAVPYYAWCMAQIQVAATPERVRKGAGRYPQPVRFSHDSASMSTMKKRGWEPGSSKTS